MRVKGVGTLRLACSRLDSRDDRADVPGVARALVAAGTALALGACQAPGASDPFRLEGVSFGSAVKARQGVPFTDGLTVLQNHGDEPVRLLSLRQEGASGLQLLGVQIAGLARSIGSQQQVATYPPTGLPPERSLGPLVDLSGYVVPPGRESADKGVELLIGLRKTTVQRATREALRLTYEVDGHRRTLRVRSALTVCDAADPRVCRF